MKRLRIDIFYDIIDLVTHGSVISIGPLLVWHSIQFREKLIVLDIIANKLRYSSMSGVQSNSTCTVKIWISKQNIAHAQVRKISKQFYQSLIK